MQHSLLPLLLLAACQLEDVYVYADGGGFSEQQPPQTRVDSGVAPGVRLASGSDITGFLDGKTLLMDSTHVPSHPNGYDENLNFGSATQCIHTVQMDVSGGAITVKTELAQLAGAPGAGDRGTCNRGTPSGDDVAFSTTAVLIENVQADARCFDITLTYAGFGQEGRGSISADQRTINLELFFRDQAVGHRCGDGAVGAPSVQLNQEPFTGNAVQIYSIARSES